MQLSEISEPVKVKLENLMLLSTSGPPHLVLIDLGVAETQPASNSYLGEIADRPDRRPARQQPSATRAMKAESPALPRYTKLFLAVLARARARAHAMQKRLLPALRFQSSAGTPSARSESRDVAGLQPAFIS